ncbi:hypothetical protein E4U59_003183 [Claviceps monticola]|nr:hypothetical protein E4U59_003183 [Claviceps monticola]
MGKGIDPIALSRDKHKDWFRRKTAILKGKWVFYTLENPILEFAFVREIENTTATETGTPLYPSPTPERLSSAHDAAVDAITNGISRLGGSWDEKEKGAVGNFAFNRETYIDGCWTFLKTYRGRIYAAKSFMRTSCPDEALLMTLTTALDKDNENRSTVGSLASQDDLSVEQNGQVSAGKGVQPLRTGSDDNKNR